ncbi:MAG: M23 family metallopeptidase [Flammeovirgaceae bacterium]|nr:M23 family metallopeptidase [Flammeovirgaceae bacterium]MDW8288128.1 M23 family metallopeptidase [Flammeovirgaceae bacterium]
MAKIKYYYDTETCRYERVKVSYLDITINAIGLLFFCLLLAFGLSLAYSKYFPSQREASLIKENEELILAYKLMQKELETIQKMMEELQHRDDNIYRVIFEAEPIPSDIRIAGIGGSKKYQDLMDKGLSQEQLIISTLEKIDKMKRQMYIQTKSYDEIIDLATNKAEMLASIPAIQPLFNEDLTRFASGYGMRIHPILKTKRMHTGVDFSAPQGTPIYATGDGVVTKVEFDRGYGKFVEIDHGFGYVTRYAHMSKFDVRKGQRVKRGAKIGEVGNTGLSTAPHVHYEVIHNDRPVNPIMYFFSDLTAEQYDKLLKMSSIENQSLGY